MCKCLSSTCGNWFHQCCFVSHKINKSVGIFVKQHFHCFFCDVYSVKTFIFVNTLYCFLLNKIFWVLIKVISFFQIIYLLYK